MCDSINGVCNCGGKCGDACKCKKEAAKTEGVVIVGIGGNSITSGVIESMRGDSVTVIDRSFLDTVLQRFKNDEDLCKVTYVHIGQVLSIENPLNGDNREVNIHMSNLSKDAVAVILNYILDVKKVFKGLYLVECNNDEVDLTWRISNGDKGETKEILINLDRLLLNIVKESLTKEVTEGKLSSKSIIADFLDILNDKTIFSTDGACFDTLDVLYNDDKQKVYKTKDVKKKVLDSCECKPKSVVIMRGSLDVENKEKGLQESKEDGTVKSIEDGSGVSSDGSEEGSKDEDDTVPVYVTISSRGNLASNGFKLWETKKLVEDETLSHDQMLQYYLQNKGNLKESKSLKELVKEHGVDTLNMIDFFKDPNVDFHRLIKDNITHYLQHSGADNGVQIVKAPLSKQEAVINLFDKYIEFFTAKEEEQTINEEDILKNIIVTEGINLKRHLKVNKSCYNVIDKIPKCDMCSTCTKDLCRCNKDVSLKLNRLVSLLGKVFSFEQIYILLTRAFVGGTLNLKYIASKGLSNSALMAIIYIFDDIYIESLEKGDIYFEELVYALGKYLD